MRVDGADVVDACFGVCHALGDGGVAVVIRGEVGVHAHSSYERPLPSRKADVGEQVGGGDMDGGVVSCCRRAVGQGPGHEVAVYHLSTLEICERGLHREGVCLQPVEEGCFPEEPRVGMLRGVSVSIDESGEEEGISFELNRCCVLPRVLFLYCAQVQLFLYKGDYPILVNTDSALFTDFKFCEGHTVYEWSSVDGPLYCCGGCHGGAVRG